MFNPASRNSCAWKTRALRPSAVCTTVLIKRNTSAYDEQYDLLTQRPFYSLKPDNWTL